MSREHLETPMHGHKHAPWGGDPALTERWHTVGAAGEPAFQNGWGNIGGSYGSTRFRLIVGPAVTGVETQSLEIILAVTGGTTGSTVFTLPAGYYEWCQGAWVPGSGHDSTGAYRAFHINGATGDVVDGV